MSKTEVGERILKAFEQNEKNGNHKLELSSWHKRAQKGETSFFKCVCRSIVREYRADPFE